MNNLISISFDKSTLRSFDARCEIIMRNVLTGTKKATTEACEEIFAESQKQVPRVSSTLATSGYYEVRRRSDVSSYLYEGTVGYGGNGDPINPKTGERASEYMVAVHERLDVEHPVGKAKFLEDPVREYADRKFSRTVFKYAKESLAAFSS